MQPNDLTIEMMRGRGDLRACRIDADPDLTPGENDQSHGFARAIVIGVPLSLLMWGAIAFAIFHR